MRREQRAEPSRPPTSSRGLPLTPQRQRSLLTRPRVSPRAPGRMGKGRGGAWKTNGTSCTQAGLLPRRRVQLPCMKARVFMQPVSLKDNLDNKHFPLYIRNSTKPARGETLLSVTSFSPHGKSARYACSSNSTDERQTQEGWLSR